MIIDPKRILLVEDNPGDVRLLVELLDDIHNRKYSLTHVTRIGHALDRIKQDFYDVLLLDLSLPDGSGLETVRQVCGAVPHLPIIVLTGLEDDALAIEAVQAGAQDYLIKGQVTGPFLTRSMDYAIERKKMEERLHYMATHDILTNLPNRVLFSDRLTHSIQQSKRNQQHVIEKWEIAVMLLDLDNFKVVNDTLGHPQGDVLLQAVAQRLRSTIRQSDTVARMGGDEFMMIFENLTGQEDAKVLGNKILELFSTPFLCAGISLSITASVGISLYPDDGTDFQALMQAADIAMYYSKRERNRFWFYGKWMEKQ
jgi:diguanylate cyclase (GGDEF)-like protein